MTAHSNETLISSPWTSHCTCPQSSFIDAHGTILAHSGCFLQEATKLWTLEVVQNEAITCESILQWGGGAQVGWGGRGGGRWVVGISLNGNETFQRFLISWFRSFKAFHIFWEEIDPMLQNFLFVLSGRS